MDYKNVKVTELVHGYDESFEPSQEYLDAMPDLQNSDFIGMPISYVGIQNLKVPTTIRQKDGSTQQVLATIYGEVDLDSEHKGINMSRLVRRWLSTRDVIFDIDKLEELLKDYQKKMNSFDAHILMNFPYYLWLPALRTKEDDGMVAGGYQVYNVTFDCSLDKNGIFRKIMHTDFIYQSLCPCSEALSEYAETTRGVAAHPHNQRSIARVSVESADLIWIEDIIDHCRKALVNETMVFCKRADEMAHAERSASDGGHIFVEDAVRRMATELNNDSRIRDWKVICSHRESIHNFDCHSVLTKGIVNSVFDHKISIGEYKDLAI